MNFLKNKTKEIFIHLSRNSNFIKNCIEGGFVEGIREIMDTLSLKELKQISSNVWNTLSKKSPEEAMNFLNNRRDKEEVFIHLSRKSNFIENCIKGGLGKEIRDIIFELNLQNDESFKNVMKKLK